MMDRLDGKAIERLQDITYKNTASLFGGKINIIFFDATTIYFKVFSEDEFKKNGHSKDHKFGQPQVLLSLLVTEEGLQLGYRVFDGNKYEGATLSLALTEIKKKYEIENVIFVADNTMMAGYNTKFLDENNFSYVLGARLKSLPKDLKDKILKRKNYTQTGDGLSIATFDYNSKRLIVSYSQESAKITLDEDKIKKDSAWDGLLGVIKNDKDRSPLEILSHYHNLYVIEDAFKLTKHDLVVRPVFHFKPERISAHIAICFCAYSLVKHLKYRIRLQYKKMSSERIKQILVRVQTPILSSNKKKIRYGLPSRMSTDARKIYDIFKIKKNLTPYIIKKFVVPLKIGIIFILCLNFDFF